MKNRLFVCIAMTFLLFASAWSGETRGRIPADVSWLCYFGENRRILDAAGYDLLILEPDRITSLSPQDKKERLCVGYLNIGEVESGIGVFSRAKEMDCLLPPKEGASRLRTLDLRSEKWRRMVVDELSVSIIAAGYDGFLVDGVDVALGRMRENISEYFGMDDAVVALMLELRLKHPNAVILLKGGGSVFPMIATKIDGVMFDGAVSGWVKESDGSYTYDLVSFERQSRIQPYLEMVKALQLPALSVEYAARDNEAERARIRRAAKEAGFVPYVSVRELDEIPEAAPVDAE